MNIETKKISDIIPYQRNAKKHSQVQIDNVAQSIKEFGIVQPIVIDKDNNIIIGHCRTLACKKLGIEEVPVVKMEDLTPEEANKLRLLDNKLNESEWDFELLAEDIPDLDFDGFEIDWELPEVEDYEKRMQEFQERMASGELSEDDEEYQEFLQKFEAKKTTDDCYTPQNIYEAVADWVEKEYNVSKNNFVRPFYPGGDYQKEKYKSTDIVVDNPPFSILAEIAKFYNEKGIRYFLFAPSLTLFNTYSTAVCTNATVTYENGARVNTSFMTNMDSCQVRTAPELFKAIEEQNKINEKEMKAELPKYEYPDYVITSTRMGIFSKYGIDFRIPKEGCHFIRCLDAQKEKGKVIFGAGFLLSESQKAESQKAEREKAEREKAEREKAEREKAEKWELSDREMEIVKSLK